MCVCIHTGIKNALLSMDEQVLTEENLTILTKCMPTPDELQVVSSYDGNTTLLSKTEQFFLVIKTVPRVALRVDLFAFKLGFEKINAEHLARIQVCEQALTALQGSKGLKRVLEVVLALGNYLNGGTKKGGAYGFKISTLAKLRSQKNTQNSGTLLSFLLQTLTQYYPDMVHFYQEFHMLAEASLVEFRLTHTHTHTHCTYILCTHAYVITGLSGLSGLFTSHLSLYISLSLSHTHTLYECVCAYNSVCLIIRRNNDYHDNKTCF